MSRPDDNERKSERTGVRRFEELSPPQVMALAIDIERSNARRFRAFAEAFGGYDEQVAQRLIELAEEEDAHELTLVQTFEQQFGGSIPSVEEDDVDVVIEAFDLFDSEQQIFDSMEPILVYELALRAENMAHNFYLRAAAACEKPKLAEIYKQLAEMEDDHVGWFEEKIRSAKES